MRTTFRTHRNSFTLGIDITSWDKLDRSLAISFGWFSFEVQW
jgi:hypothetical protein